MSEPRQQHIWSTFLKFFNEQNEGRPTRVGVFEDGNDFWLESGLPMAGIDIDPAGGSPTISILLGTFTHTVRNVRSMKVLYTQSGEEDGIDFVDAEGKITVLRFESAI
jgi:hypothetical protein